jgi:hypothetical protein
MAVSRGSSVVHSLTGRHLLRHAGQSLFLQSAIFLGFAAGERRLALAIRGPRAEQQQTSADDQK